MAIQIDYTSVLGYYSPADIDSVEDSTLKTFLIFHDVMNLSATLLSPIAGLARAVVAAITLYFYNQKHPQTDNPIIEGRKQFLIAQVIRGGVELLGFGTILGIADVVISLNRYHLLCFAQAKV